LQVDYIVSVRRYKRLVANDYPVLRQQDFNELIILTYGYPFS